MTPFDRDWDFLVANKDKFTFAGSEIVDFPFDASGASAKDCFKKFDTSGKVTSCREPELIKEVIRCKKAINFQIKMWGLGFYDMGMGIPDYLSEFINPPQWITDSLLNQIRKAPQPSWIKPLPPMKEKPVTPDYQAQINRMIESFDKRKKMDDLLALLKRNGQGLTLGQEDIIRHAFGVERIVKPEGGVWGVEVWVSEKLPIVYGLAKDTEMLDAPRPTITDSEEYKAMLAARDKRSVP